MPLDSDGLTAALAHLRTLLANKREHLRRELDYSEKRDAVLSVKERYPNISDDQIHDVMRRVEE